MRRDAAAASRGDDEANSRATCGLDILINNSGIIADRTIKKMALDDFESVIRVNLTGTFIATQKRLTFCAAADGS